MAAGATYEPIATTTLGSNQTSITFSSISSAYTDLRLVIVPLATGAGDWNLLCRVNSDSGANYSATVLRGDGTSASSARYTGNNYIVAYHLVGFKSTPSFYVYDFFSYSGSTNKTILATGSNDYNGSGTTVRAVNLWRNTAAITSISFTTDATNNFATGTIATLYGILKA